MHRPTLLFGLGLIVLMCLIPPVETGAIDRMSDALSGETSSRIEYRPVWTQADADDGEVVSALREGEVAGRRLALQILVVAVVTGGLAYKLEG